jgi:hypothetical protein
MAEPTGRESSGVSAVRTAYRCRMCHKGCRIPCRLTAAEFWEMALHPADEGSVADGVDGVDGNRPRP